MKKINWVSVLHDPQYIGVRITMIGVVIGFFAFVVATCGFMWFGISIFVVGLSTTLTGVVVNFSNINRRR